MVELDGIGRVGWGLYKNLWLVSIKFISGLIASGSPSKFSNINAFFLLLRFLSRAYRSCA